MTDEGELKPSIGDASVDSTNTPRSAEDQNLGCAAARSPVAATHKNPERVKVRRRQSLAGKLRRLLRSHFEFSLTILLILVVFGSLLAVGAVHVPTLLWIAPVGIAAGVLALFVDTRLASRVPTPAVVLLLLALYSLLQSVPLPLDWLRRLSPVAAQTWLEALRLAEIPTVAHRASISVDPGASRVEALKFLCYASVFLSAVALGRSAGSSKGAVIVVYAAVTAGVLSLVHGVAGVTHWFGIYEPTFAGVHWAPAPLLNPNNFAGYLNLATFTALGLLVMRKPPLPRLVLTIFSALLCALTVLTASRGGVLSLLVGLCAFGGALVLQQRRARERGGYQLPIWAPLAAALSIGGLLAVLGSNRAIWTELLDETTSKLRIAEYSQPVVRDHFWTGVGRGAFETAFSAYRVAPGHNITQYAENFVVQWLVEWGVPVAAAAFLVLAYALRPGRLGVGRNALPTGAYLGVVVLLLQNLVDLALEVASVSIALFVVLGSLWGGAQYLEDRKRRDEGSNLDAGNDSERRMTTFATAASLSVVALGVVCEWLSASTGIPDAMDERSRLRDALATSVDGSNQVHANVLERQVRPALLRHPADPYVPMVGAWLTRQLRLRSLPWVNLALRRDPQNARAYLLLAQVLVDRGAIDQAMTALRSTVERDPLLTSIAARFAVSVTKDLAVLDHMVPDTAKGVDVLNSLAVQLGGGAHPAEQLTLLRASLQRNAAQIEVHEMLINALLAALAQPTGVCSGAAKRDCDAELSQHIDTVHRIAPKSPTSLLVRARMLLQDGKADEAEQLLSGQCEKLGSRIVECQMFRVGIAGGLRDPARFERAQSACLSAACTTPSSCASASRWLGDLLVSRGALHTALTLYERAAREAPDAEILVRVAGIAFRIGAYGQAESALRNARRFGLVPGAAELQKQLDESRRQRLFEQLGGP